MERAHVRAALAAERADRAQRRPVARPLPTVSIRGRRAPLQGSTGGHLEREADGIAERVLAGGTSSASLHPPPITWSVGRPVVQAASTGACCEACRDAGPSLSWAADRGRPLADADRSYFEARLGRDLGAVRLHTDAAAAGVAAALHARAFTVGHDIGFAAGAHEPGTDGGRKLVAHELVHVVQQRAGPDVVQRSALDGDPSLSTWFEQEQARHAALEAAETGSGRDETVARLSTMPDDEARRDAPGIAYRAQDRGDVELAVLAAERLASAWLASEHLAPTSFGSFGADDSVDVLLPRAERAFGDGNVELGGALLAVALVQLVRAAAAVVLRRTDPTSPAAEIVLPLQRMQEAEVLDRVERARAMAQGHALAAGASGDRALIERFEAMTAALRESEVRAGPAIAEDLGTGGITDPPPEEAPGRAAGRTGARGAAAVPALPEPAPGEPVVRAVEKVVPGPHPDLEGALVMVSTTPPTHYVNVRSPRHGISGTFAGAHVLAAQLFGRRSAVIAQEFGVRVDGVRETRYVVAGLNTRLNPPDPSLGVGREPVGFEGIRIMGRAASPNHVILAVTTDDWFFFNPGLLEALAQVRAVEAALDPGDVGGLSAGARRSALFGEVDRLLAAGETQEAADQLATMGARAFALVDTATKTRYIQALLDAFTLQAHELTVLEVFRSLSGLDELRAVLHGLHDAGVLRQLRTDLQHTFTQLLTLLGQRFGTTTISAAQAMRILGELELLSPLPGITIRADGSIVLGTDAVAEFVAAFEGLFETISGAITGIVDLLVDPEALIRGIGQLVYLAVMFELARHGYPPAVLYVSNLLSSLARQLSIALGGIVVLQEHVPPGVELVNDLQRSIKWRVIWEVASLFIGVGEAVALIRAVRSGRAAAGIAEAVAGVSRLGRGLAEGAATSRLMRLATRVEGRAASEAHVLTVMSRLPAEEQARLARLVGEVDDVSRLSAEAAEAVRGVRADADTLAHLQQLLGDDLGRATTLWHRLADAGLDGPATRRVLDGLAADAAVQERTLRAIEAAASHPQAQASMIEAVASSTARVDAVERLGIERYARIWQHAGGDATAADALLAALDQRRTGDPAAWQRLLEGLDDPSSSLWRELDEGAAARGARPVPAEGPPVPAAPRTVEQRQLLEASGRQLDGALLTAEQRAAEVDVVRRGSRRPSTVEGYVVEVDVGNGHHWRRRPEPDGTWCRFTKPTLCGTRIEELDPARDLRFPRAPDEVPRPSRTPDPEGARAEADRLTIVDEPPPGMTERTPSGPVGISRPQGEAGVRRHADEVLDELRALQARGQLADEVPREVPSLNLRMQEAVSEMLEGAMTPGSQTTLRDIAEVLGPAGAREVRMPVARGTSSGVAGSRLVDHLFPHPTQANRTVLRESKNLGATAFNLGDPRIVRELTDDLTLLRHPTFADAIVEWRVDSVLPIHRNTLRALDNRVAGSLGERITFPAMRFDARGNLVAPLPLQVSTPSGRFALDFRTRTSVF